MACHQRQVALQAETPTKLKSLVSFRRLGILLGLLVGASLTVLMLLPSIAATREQNAQAQAVAAVLADARKVTFTEYLRYYWKGLDDEAEEHKYIRQDVVLQQVEVSLEQVDELRAATGPRLVFSDGSTRVKGCYDPHHQIVVTRWNGSTAVIEVCFKCQRFSFDKWHMANIPDRWLSPLSRAFTHAGLPPLGDGEYVNLATEKMKR